MALKPRDYEYCVISRGVEAFASGGVLLFASLLVYYSLHGIFIDTSYRLEGGVRHSRDDTLDRAHPLPFEIFQQTQLINSDRSITFAS